MGYHAEGEAGAISVGDPELRKSRLLAHQCGTCVFRPSNLMNLGPGRLRSLVGEAVASDSYIICHDTLPYGGYPEAKSAICRGFYDRYSTGALRVIERLWGFVQISPPGDPTGDEAIERSR